MKVAETMSRLESGGIDQMAYAECDGYGSYPGNQVGFCFPDVSHKNQLSLFRALVLIALIVSKYDFSTGESLRT